MKDKNGEKGKIIKKRIKKLTFYDPNGREIGVFEEKKGKLNLRR